MLSEELNEAVIHIGNIRAIADLIENSERAALQRDTLESAMLVIRHQAEAAIRSIETAEQATG